MIILLADINGNTNIKDSLRQTSLLTKPGGTPQLYQVAWGWIAAKMSPLAFLITGKWGHYSNIQESLSNGMN
jgi:hypothetical protein